MSETHTHYTYVDGELYEGNGDEQELQENIHDNESWSIAFPATVAKITTMADHGLRVYFDLPEYATIEALRLMECKRHGVNVRVSVSALQDEDD